MAVLRGALRREGVRPRARSRTEVATSIWRRMTHLSLLDREFGAGRFGKTVVSSGLDGQLLLGEARSGGADLVRTKAHGRGTTSCDVVTEGWRWDVSHSLLDPRGLGSGRREMGGGDQVLRRNGSALACSAGSANPR